jgi:hypothetical protein
MLPVSPGAGRQTIAWAMLECNDGAEKKALYLRSSDDGEDRVNAGLRERIELHIVKRNINLINERLSRC